MKCKFLILFVKLLFAFSLSAQIKHTTTSIKPKLDEVIKDFPNQFKTIKGKPLSEGDQNMEYVSGVVIKDAMETKLIAHSNQKNTSWVWECKLFETETLDQLKRYYKMYYNDIAGKSLLNKTSGIHLIAVSPYSSPSEELRLWSNQFIVKDAPEEYKNLVVDLVAEYINFQWTIYLRAYDKEKDEEMKPTIKQ